MVNQEWKGKVNADLESLGSICFRVQIKLVRFLA